MKLAYPKPDRHADKSRRIDYSKSAYPKDAPKPDAIYRAWVRAKGCVVRRLNPELHTRCSPMIGSEYGSKRAVIDFCHTPAKRGMGQKAADLGNGIGMCHDLHMEQEQIGWPRFERKYGIGARQIAVELAAEYKARQLPKKERGK